MMLLHADAIAQNRAAGVRTGRIDGDHAYGLAFCAQSLRELIAQRALARARSAGDAEDQRAPGARKQLAQQLLGLGPAIFDPRRGAGQRADVPGQNFFG